MLLILLTLLPEKRRLNAVALFVCTVLEIVLINWLIGLNGAASNPYAIILLIPLVAGLVQLPFRLATAVLLISTGAQLLQLLASPASHHDGMAQHAANMVWSFAGTSVFIAAIIFYYRRQLRKRNAAIVALRETQLRNEQLLAIGTAAAQLTHDAATPVQTINLLLEEWRDSPDPALIKELSEQVSRLNGLLSDWREVADDVRESRTTTYRSSGLIKALRHSLTLARPEALIHWQTCNSDCNIHADRTLLPALTNIVINACEEASGETDNGVSITQVVSTGQWTLRIANPLNNAPPEHAPVIGRQLVHSEKGNGVASVLTNATIERFGGKVSWEIIDSRGTLTLETTVILPAEQ